MPRVSVHLGRPAGAPAADQRKDCALLGDIAQAAAAGSWLASVVGGKPEDHGISASSGDHWLGLRNRAGSAKDPAVWGAGSAGGAVAANARSLRRRRDQTSSVAKAWASKVLLSWPLAGPCPDRGASSQADAVRASICCVSSSTAWACVRAR